MYHYFMRLTLHFKLLNINQHTDVCIYGTNVYVRTITTMHLSVIFTQLIQTHPQHTHSVSRSISFSHTHKHKHSHTHKQLLSIVKHSHVKDREREHFQTGGIACAKKDKSFCAMEKISEGKNVIK
jgi:hypothetical protein